MARQADVDMEPEEKLYTSLVHEAGFTLPLPGTPSLKEFCLSKLKMVSTYLFLHFLSLFLYFPKHTSTLLQQKF